MKSRYFALVACVVLVVCGSSRSTLAQCVMSDKEVIERVDPAPKPAPI
jgi:hypothetical protein